MRFMTTSICLILFCCVSVAIASVAKTINYQGHLASSGGTPVNAAVDMTFTIYNAATSGTTLWTEDQTVQVNNGIYAVALGAINPIDPAIIDGDLWLGVKVGTDAEMTPRQKLNSVPYALKAGGVDNLTISTTQLIDNSITTTKVFDGAITDVKITGPISADKIPEIATMQAQIVALQAQVLANANQPPIVDMITGNYTYEILCQPIDYDDAHLEIAWTLTTPVGSSAVLTFPCCTTPLPFYRTSFTPDVYGDYSVECHANDGKETNSYALDINHSGSGTNTPFNVLTSGSDRQTYTHANAVQTWYADIAMSGPFDLYNWYQASGVTDATYNPAGMSFCEDLVFDGFSDWRLPTKNELKYFLSHKPVTAMNPPNSQYFWSSTEGSSVDKALVHAVHAYDMGGNEAPIIQKVNYPEFDKSFEARVNCVRDGI